MNYYSVEPMSEITKANLELLIREVQDLNPNDEIKVLLDTWVVGNDLHPEKVKISNGIAINTVEGKMREKIAPIIKQWHEDTTDSYENLADQIHKEYMAWFREEISKLKPLSDEEIEKVENPYCDKVGCGWDLAKQKILALLKK